VWFSPSVEQQRELAMKIGDRKEAEGLSGQFVVQYDVERDPQAGEVLVSSARFVTRHSTDLTANSIHYLTPW
jgi:hypothetical protein